MVDDMKRALCEVHETGLLPGGASAPPPAKSYELPDGQSVRLEALRHVVPELMFSADAAEQLFSPLDAAGGGAGGGGGGGSGPSARDVFRHLQAVRAALPAFQAHHNAGVTTRLAVDGAGSGASSSSSSSSSSSLPIPLPKAVSGAMLACAPEVRRDLCNNVLLTGGGANMRDLHKRMHWELSAVVPAAFKPRIVAPSPIEREHAVWIGGSVMGALRAAGETEREALSIRPLSQP